MTSLSFHGRGRPSALPQFKTEPSVDFYRLPFNHSLLIMLQLHLNSVLISVLTVKT